MLSFFQYFELKFNLNAKNGKLTSNIRIKWNFFTAVCLHKNQHTQRKFLYFVNRNIGEPAKIGHIFTKYSFLKMIEIENVANESCSPNLIFI